MSFEITDSDIIEAFKKKRSEDVYNRNIGNAIRHSGSVVDSLVAIKTRVPRVIDCNLPNLKRLVTIYQSNTNGVQVQSSDIRLFPIAEELFRSMALPVMWECNNIPVGDVLSIKFILPTNIPHMRQLLTKVSEFLDYFFHIAVKKNTAICKDECLQNFGSRGHRWIYPSLCQEHVELLTTDCIRDYINGVDRTPEFIDNSDVAMSVNYNRFSNAIFKHHRSFKKYTQSTSQYCVFCGHNVTEEYSYLTNALCIDCCKSINWRKFETDYRCELTSWEDLLVTKKKLSRYQINN